MTLSANFHFYLLYSSQSTHKIHIIFFKIISALCLLCYFASVVSISNPFVIMQLSYCMSYLQKLFVIDHYFFKYSENTLQPCVFLFTFLYQIYISFSLCKLNCSSHHYTFFHSLTPFLCSYCFLIRQHFPPSSISICFENLYLQHKHLPFPPKHIFVRVWKLQYKSTCFKVVTPSIMKCSYSLTCQMKPQ